MLLEVICENDLKWGKQRVKEEIDRALDRPQDYPACWTWALLLVIHNLLTGLPPEERMSLDPELGKLETNRNDFVDAAIVGVGARYGTLLTNDEGLYERCRILYERDLIGIAPERFE